MRFQYRITFAEGNSGTCSTNERVWDCLAFFRKKFGSDRVLRVEGRQGAGEWVDSALLPTCREEADALPR